MSENFEQFQPKVCDATPDPLPLKKLCPACTPNKSFVAPDWRQIPEETYLDEAACEYKICVTINNAGDSFTAAEFRDAVGSNKYPTREHLFRSFIQPAIRLMLDDTDKLIAQQIICASHDGPAFAGRVANELLQEYDNFDGIFMDLKDDPLGEAKDCPDLISNTVFGSTSFDPEEPLSFTQFVLQNISNEVKNPFALELYARAIDFDIDPMQNILKVLVSIPAFILDAVPDNPTGEEIQEEAVTTKAEVELEVPKLYGQLFRMKAALRVYSTYQSFFYQTQDGFLKFKDSKKDYYASSFSAKIQTFYEDLKAEANNGNKPRKKRWNIRSNIPSVVVKNADKIRITFMEGENGNPYRIKRIEAKKEGCEYQRICGRNSKFAKKYSLKPTVMNYIAKINEIDTALKARESYPWLDFLVKFTYPLLTVDYGTLNEESVKDSLGECVADNVKEFGGDLKDYVLNEALSLVQSMAYEFNSKASCQDLLAESEIEKKYFQQETFTPGLDAKKEVNETLRESEGEALEKEYSEMRKEISSLKEKLRLLDVSYSSIENLLELRETDALSFELNGGPSEMGASIKRDITQYIKDLENIDKEKKSTHKEIEKIKNQADALNQDSADGGLSRKGKRRLRKNAAKRAREESREESSPYWKEAKKLALEELKYQDGILSSLVDIEAFMTTGKITSPKANKKAKAEPEKLLQKMTLCNVKSLSINAIQCLFSGVTQEAAFKKIVESALKAMDIDVMGYFIQSLPPDKQSELREMAKSKWDQMPMPWEEGYEGGSTKEANPYLSYLGSNKENLSVESKIQSYKDEIAKIENEISEIQEGTELVEAYGQTIAKAKEETIGEIITYTIAKGDTLSSIAKIYLEDASRWTEIRDENNIADERKIKPGQVITITTDIIRNRFEHDEQYRDEITEAERMVSKELASLESKMKLLQDQLSKTLSESSEWPTKEDGITPVDFKDLPQERKDELIQAQKNAQGTLGTALGDIQAEIIDMYIQNLLDVVGVDELMSHLDRFPGGQLVQRYINQVNCAFQGLHNPPVKSFLSTLSFDPCGEGNLGLSFPEKMKDFDFRALKPWRKDFLAILRNKFIDKLETVLTQILVRMIVKLIQTVDDALCASINAAGQFAAGLLTGNNQGLDEAVKDAFCPDADDKDLEQIKKNLFNNALGKGGGGLQAPNTEAYDCLFQALNATMSKQEVIGLLTNTPSNMDDFVVSKMSQLVNTRCPDLAPVLGDPEDIKDCFGSMQKFIPPELRVFLKEQASQIPESPIFDSICLTQEELDKWNEDRKSIYTRNGLDEKTAQELIDKANARALDDLGTVSDMLQKGPEGLLGEAIDDLFRQDDPGCETSASAIVLEDEDLAAEKLEMLNDFYKTIEKKFISDLIEGKHSILNNILIDTRGNRLNKHERRADDPLLRPNYVDNEEMWERRKDGALFQFDNLLGGYPYSEDRMKGMFPETVGGRMLQKMKNMNLQYDSKAKNTVVMKFKDVQDDPDYESKLVFRVLPRKNPTYFVKVSETFNRTISKDEKKALGLEGSRFGGIESPESSKFRVKDRSVEQMTEEIDYDVYKEHFNVETVLFRNFLMKKANILIGNSSLGKLRNATDKMNLEAINFVRKAIIERPNGKLPVGFKFGADDQQKVTFKDLLYVNPDADPDNKLTWLYTHLPSEKVLGKSATEHPRVHFLDPAIHGGSYLFPKIYIEPATYNGWLGMIKTFIPEMEVCDDVDNGFLQINDIARRAKKIEGSLPVDKRLSQAPECRFEVPYDRQLTPANHGILEGLVIATLRTYATQFILRIMPILGSIRLSQDNYDDTLFMMMAQKMEQEFIAQEGFIDLNMVKSYTYYLLFLEQSVQVAQRQIKDGLLEETDEMKAAMRNLNRVQMNFPREIKSPRGLELTIKGASIVGYNAEWEEYFNRFDPSEYRDRLRIMLPHRRKMAMKVAAIHESKQHAEVFLAALLKKEMSGMTDRINQNMRPLPHVWDIKKYALSNKGLINFSQIKSGQSSVEVEVIEGGNQPDYGKIPNCPNKQLVSGITSNLSALSKLPEQGVLFLEKYLRVISKDGTEQVMTPSEFKELISDPSYDRNSKISDYFGEAQVINGEFMGTIGVKFGVRLIYVPHSQLGLEPNLDELKERVGKIRGFYHIPLAHFEHDVLDKVLKDIDFEDDNMGEDLKCYVDGLVETDDFKLMFETIIKVPTFSSLFGVYSYYNFFESIGVGPNEVEEDRQKKIKGKWKRKVFNDVKNILKKQFRSTYRSDDDDSEASRQEKLQFDAEWVSNLLPSSYLGLDGSIRWWQSSRIVTTKPFNKDGDDCLNDFQKIFKD